MKIKLFALLMAVLMLSGCAFGALERTADTVEDRLDRVEDVLEGEVPGDPAPEPRSTESSAALLTAQEAEQIALDHAGFTADQVKGLRTEYEIDDGVEQYDVQFYEGRWEYEFEIHAHSGKILSFDKDD